MLDICLGGGELGLRGLHLGLRDEDVVGAVAQIILTDGALVGDGLQAVEHVLHLRELGLRDGELGLGDEHGGLVLQERGLELAVIEQEQRIVFFDDLVHLHFDLFDQSGQRDADGDVFAVRLQQTGAGNVIRGGFDGHGLMRGGRALLIRGVELSHHGREGHDTADGKQKGEVTQEATEEVHGGGAG